MHHFCIPFLFPPGSCKETSVRSPSLLSPVINLEVGRSHG
jgi:hypothetical protein